MSNSRDPITPAPNAPNTSASNIGSGGRSSHGSNHIVHTNIHSFEGATSDIGTVLGLRHEKFKHKAPSFESFLEKVSTFAISNFKDGGDLKPLFRKMTDPADVFKSKKKPKKPVPDDDTKTVDLVYIDIYKEQIKLYVTRESNLRRNMEKTFGIIWGQCSNSLQSNVKGQDEFDEAYDTLDTLWLVKALKKALSGIDNKSDPRLVLHKALSELYHLKQGETGSSDKFLERFKSTGNTVELAQGASIFCVKEMAEM